MFQSRPGVPARYAVVGLALAVALLPPVAAAASASRSPAARDDVHVSRDEPYARVGGTTLRLDAYLPSSGLEPAPVVLFVHGGGWRAGHRASFGTNGRPFAPTGRYLARLGLAVFSIDYRLAPQIPYPAPLNDLRRAVRWVVRNAADLGVDPAQTALFGVSAGGTIAALAGTKGRGGRLDGARVRAVVTWSSPMSLIALAGPGAPPSLRKHLGCPVVACPERYRDASPLHHVDSSDPPSLLVNSTSELVPFTQASLMHRRLSAAGLDSHLLAVPGKRHAAQYLDVALDPTVAFLMRQLGLR